jgi:FkbM family methyltransferase
VKRKLQASYEYLRKNGFRRFCATVYAQLAVMAQIYAGGRNRTVSLDGCAFPLLKLANNPMKLALLDGSYEAPERAAVRKYLNPEWGVVELGACIGVVSCVTNRLLRNPQAHVVVEINPLAIPHLEANRERNGCSFKIVSRALAYDADSVTFRPHLDLWANFLNQGGNRPTVTVPATRLSEILAEQGFGKFALICDIEGQEFELVMHEPETVGMAELIIMELHPHMVGVAKVQRMMDSLEKLGFRLEARVADVVVLAKRG